MVWAGSLSTLTGPAVGVIEDVEGAELAVLHSIDFDAVHIRIIVAEVLTPAGVPSAPASPT